MEEKNKKSKQPFEEQDGFKTFCNDVLRDFGLGALLVGVAAGVTLLLLWLLR